MALGYTFPIYGFRFDCFDLRSFLFFHEHSSLEAWLFYLSLDAQTVLELSYVLETLNATNLLLLVFLVGMNLRNSD